MSKTIGIIENVDTGKSLILQYMHLLKLKKKIIAINEIGKYIKKNLKCQICFNTLSNLPLSLLNSSSFGEELLKNYISKKKNYNNKKCDHKIIKDLIKKYGMNVLKKPFNFDIDYKNKIKFYEDVIIFIIKSIDYNYFCDFGIICIRDIRVQWSVTAINSQVNQYAKNFDNLIKNYNKIKNKSKIKIIKFEQLINNPKYCILNLFDYLECEHKKFVTSTKQYNDWLTEVDLKNIKKYKHYGNSLKQHELDFLSEYFYDYNKQFGYPERLFIEDIYPKTLKEDIFNYENNRIANYNR